MIDGLVGWLIDWWIDQLLIFLDLQALRWFQRSSLTRPKFVQFGCLLMNLPRLGYLGWIYTHIKSPDHENLRTFENRPKAIMWEIEVQFCNSWGLKLSVKWKGLIVYGPNAISGRSWNIFHLLSHKTSCRFFVHLNFFGHLGPLRSQLTFSSSICQLLKQTLVSTTS